MKLRSLFSYRKWLKLYLNTARAEKLDDEKYLKLKYYAFMGKKLNLENPVTFNEKLQWLKLNDRRPEYTMMADKYLVREYIAEKLGEEYLIPLIGVWDSADDIDFDLLPDQFVLKCNHNSGLGMCICKDKSKLDYEKTKEKLKMGLEQDYYLTGREWPYKNVPRKIVAEQYMEDAETEELRDYKFHCFNGEPKIILVCSNRFKENGLNEDFFDNNWNLLPFGRPAHPNSNIAVKKPVNLDLMIEFARSLAKNIPFCRIDFYEINNKIYFGEITFFPASGYGKFDPDEYDMILGNMITLS